jgi:hypothetical protein
MIQQFPGEGHGNDEPDRHHKKQRAEVRIIQPEIFLYDRNAGSPTGITKPRNEKINSNRPS